MAEEKKEIKDTNERKEQKNTKEAKEKTDDKGMPEWLASILSTVGSMGGSYMLWIKPLQDRMDMLTKQITDIQLELKEVKKQNIAYEQELENIHSQVEQKEHHLNGTDYLPIKKPIGQGSYVKRRI